MIRYDKLQAMIKERGLSITQVSEMADLSWRTVKKIDKREPISFVSMLLICKALGCKIDDVIEY